MSESESRVAVVSQLTHVITLHLPELSADVHWAEIDVWLDAWLDDPLDEQPCDQSWMEVDLRHSDVAKLAWRIAVGAATLMRVCGIPFLEAGRVLSVSPDKNVVKNSWQCELAVPYVEGVPVKTTMIAYEICVEWVMHLATNPECDDLLSRFYQQLETQVLPVLLASSVMSSSAMVLLRAAHEQGVPWFYEGQGICQLGWGAQSLHFINTCIESDSAVGIDIASHKFLAAQWLRRACLPVPEHYLINNEDHAVQASHSLGWPVVIKPVDCERGEGVSIYVDSDAKVREAFHHARLSSAQIMVERQAPGVCHRLLVVRGEVMYVVKRLPVAVQGDGYQTVAELVVTKMNGWKKRAPWRRPPPLPIDSFAEKCLRQAGLSLDAIPEKGVWAPLRRIESTADGGRDEDMTAVLHPDNKALAIRAAALFDMDIAGVDIISTDISVPWHINGAIINEINASPSMGASVSSKAAMPAVIERLMRGGGRIRIEAFVGGDAAFQRARQRQKELVTRGVACYLTSHQLTQNEAGNMNPMACDGLFLRCRALLIDKAVGAIMLVIQTDELIRKGFPVDILDKVEQVDTEVAGDLEGLLVLLRNHTADNAVRN